jgi:hypothetical protein
MDILRATPYIAGMKKVKFDNAQAIALHQSLGKPLTSDQAKPVKLEGWLVDDHLCVQKPLPKSDADWRVSLYPWGDLIVSEFFTKADATAFAEDVSALELDWERVRSAGVEDESYQLAIMQVRAIRGKYEVEGLMKSPA